MNRLELQQRIQRHLNNPTYFTGIDFNDSIQDGLDEIVAFSGCNYNTATIPFVNNLTYYDFQTILPDFLGVVAIFNATIRKWMTPTSIRKLDQVRIDWESAPGTPEYFSVVNFRYTAIYKKPISDSYGNMYVYYKAKAPVLVDGTEIPIPADHMTVLESYVKCDLWEQNQEFTKAGSEYTNYVTDVMELRTFMSKKDPGRTMGLMR